MIRFLIILLMSAGVMLADLENVRNEPKLEKRSERALDNGEKALDKARSAYRNGNNAAVRGALQEVQESVELAIEALRETGKHPSRNTKHYKRGEIKTRQLQRRLESFKQEANFDDREAIEAVTRRVQEIHEEFLNGVMSRKNKS